MLKYLAHINAPELRKVENRTQLVNSIRKHPLTKSGILSIARKLKLTSREVAQLMGISIRTFQRQGNNVQVSVSASELGIKLAELYEIGLNAFDGDKESFVKWLNLPIPAINNQIPIQLITTSLGIDLIIDELLRIEHSVY